MVILYNDSMEDKTEHDALKVFLSIIGIHLKNDKKSNLNAWIFVKTEIIDFYCMTNKTWYSCSSYIFSWWNIVFCSSIIIAIIDFVIGGFVWDIRDFFFWWSFVVEVMWWNGHFGQSVISYPDEMQNHHQSSWFITKRWHFRWHISIKCGWWSELQHCWLCSIGAWFRLSFLWLVFLLYSMKSNLFCSMW